MSELCVCLPQRTESCPCCLGPGPAGEPGPAAPVAPGWPHDISAQRRQTTGGQSTQ